MTSKFADSNPTLTGSAVIADRQVLSHHTFKTRPSSPEAPIMRKVEHYRSGLQSQAHEYECLSSVPWSNAATRTNATLCTSPGLQENWAMSMAIRSGSGACCVIK